MSNHLLRGAYRYMRSLNAEQLLDTQHGVDASVSQSIAVSRAMEHIDFTRCNSALAYTFMKPGTDMPFEACVTVLQPLDAFGTVAENPLVRARERILASQSDSQPGYLIPMLDAQTTLGDTSLLVGISLCIGLTKPCSVGDATGVVLIKYTADSVVTLTVVNEEQLSYRSGTVKPGQRLALNGTNVDLGGELALTYDLLVEGEPDFTQLLQL